MKINYTRLRELSLETLTPSGEQMSCYYIIQAGVEKFLYDESLSENHKNFLMELGVLELTPEEMATQNIVGPFNFNSNGFKEA